MDFYPNAISFELGPEPNNGIYHTEVWMYYKLRKLVNKHTDFTFNNQ